MEWPDSDHGVFAISVAAELAGLHPQTLRVYEREGLIDPDRTGGGTRRYSLADVERLRQITTLTDAGINLAGVKRILEMAEETRLLQQEVARLQARANDDRREAADTRGSNASLPPERRRKEGARWDSSTR